MQHKLHYEQLVKDKGAKAAYEWFVDPLTELAREQFVFDSLRNNADWATFSALEQQHAKEYIISKGGKAW